MKDIIKTPKKIKIFPWIYVYAVLLGGSLFILLGILYILEGNKYTITITKDS